MDLQTHTWSPVTTSPSREACVRPSGSVYPGIPVCKSSLWSLPWLVVVVQGLYVCACSITDSLWVDGTGWLLTLAPANCAQPCRFSINCHGSRHFVIPLLPLSAQTNADLFQFHFCHSDNLTEYKSTSNTIANYKHA